MSFRTLGAAALAALATAQPFPTATLPPSAVTAPFTDEVVRGRTSTAAVPSRGQLRRECDPTRRERAPTTPLPRLASLPSPPQPNALALKPALLRSLPAHPKVNCKRGDCVQLVARECDHAWGGAIPGLPPARQYCLCSGNGQPGPLASCVTPLTYPGPTLSGSEWRARAGRRQGAGVSCRWPSLSSTHANRYVPTHSPAAVGRPLHVDWVNQLPVSPHVLGPVDPMPSWPRAARCYRTCA